MTVPPKLSGPMALAVAMMLTQAVRIAWLARLPDSLLVQHIPDDAFYYLVLAKNFAAHGRWTFDGVSPSSGFHLLWGYLLALLAAMLPHAGFHAVFLLCGLFAALLMSVAAYWIAASAGQVFARNATWGVAVVLLSAIVLVQGTWLMESPLVLFFAAACVAQLTPGRPDAVRHSLLLAFALGVAGSLSRSDFGFLPFWLAVAHFVAAKFDPDRAQPGIAFMQLLGAASGVLLVFVHTHHVSGHFFQASAEVKLWWAHLQGTLTLPVLHLVENVYDPFFNNHPLSHAPSRIDIAGFKLRQVFFLIVLAGAACRVRRTWNKLEGLLLGSLAAAMVSYGIVYRLDGGLQDWYVVNFAVPLCMLTAAAGTAIPKRWSALAKTAVCVTAPLSCALSLRAYVPWQEATYRAGLLLRTHPEWKPAGTWNAGVMSYFGGGGVVNMDGLVNDDLLNYIRSGTLIRYVDQRHMSYLIESPNIFTGILAKRSGIGDDLLAACVDSRTILFPDDPFDNAYGEHLTLFHLSATCLARRASPVSP